MGNLDQQLELALDGRITFDDFARGTKREFERMAGYLMRRWIPPSWYGPEDLVQDLWLGAWMCIWEWSPVMGASLTRFVVFNTMATGKRALHKARGALLSGTQDKNPSRFERPLSSFGLEGEGETMAECLLAEEAIAEQTMIEREEHEDRKREGIAKALAACKTETERAVIRALANAEDVEGGVAAIYEDIDQRIAHRLGSEEHAARFVVRTFRSVVERVEESMAS